MKLHTRIQTKRMKRLHPDWTDDAILEHIRTLTDAAGPYPDVVTIEDVKDAIDSMPENRPGRLI